MRDRGLCVGRWGRPAIGWQVVGTRIVSEWFPCRAPWAKVGVASKTEISFLGELKAVPRRSWRLLIGTGSD